MAFTVAVLAGVAFWMRLKNLRGTTNELESPPSLPVESSTIVKPDESNKVALALLVMAVAGSVSALS